MDHQALLRAVETSDCKVFVEWYEKAQIQNNLVVKESVDRLTKKDLQGIWTVFKKWVLEITTTLRANMEHGHKESASDENQNFIMSALLILSTMASYTIQNMSKNDQIAGLDSSVKAMNESLKFVSCRKAGAKICEMNELYWKIYPAFEMLLSVNVIHWLLTQALQPKATVSSIKQVWNMKGSIEQLNATILQSSGLLDLFLRGLQNSKFISCNEGRKCIGCLFFFGPVVVQMLQKTMKKCIPLATIADCESMGEIFFKAWRMAPEECREAIEFSIQDLMYNAVVAHRKPLGVIEGGVNKIPMNKLLFHLLHALHRQKKQRTVAVLIYNLYKPILWRYLEASNGLVRANALCLFFDAFPFESGEGVEEDEEVRNKQWAVMLAALMDPVPLVRTIAIQGTSRILAEYWECVPINIIQEIITCMLRKLLYDSSSVDVRAHVVKGMIIMLESKLTHTLLEKMIPLTNKILHDPHEKVRAEYVSLLTYIQKLRVSKLWEVIDIQHLVVRLEVDTSKTVCRRLVTLLAPFYFPKSTPEIMFQRCLRLVIDNRMASRKFFQYANTCVGIEQMAQLILIIWKFLRNHIYKKMQQTRITNQRDETTQQHHRSSKRSRREADAAANSISGDEDKENQDLSSDSDQNEDGGHEEFNEASIMGLIDVVCILLNENKSKFKMPQNLVLWENIKSRFNKTCSLFFRYFRNSDELRSVIYLYGLLSSSSSPLMMSFVKSQLKSLDDNATSKEFGHLIDVMCNWGRGEDVLESISDHFHGSLKAITDDPSLEVSSRKTRGTGKKRVSFQKLSSEKPMLGIRYMVYILQHPIIKKRILRNNLAQVEQLSDSLSSVMDVIEKNPAILSDKDSFLFMAASLHVRIALVLACSFKREQNQIRYLEYQEKIETVLNWTKRLIISKEVNPILGDLASSIVASVSNLIMIHSLTWKLCRLFLDVVLEMVMQFPSSSNLTLAMSCAYHSLAFIWSERSIGNECDVECDESVNLLIKFALECHNSETSNEELCLNENDWPLMREIIMKILAECYRNNSEKHASLHNIVRSMVDTVRQDMMQLETGDENSAGGKYLHQIAKAIIAAFRTQNSLAETMIDEFFEVFKNEDDVVLPNLVVIVKLLEQLSLDKGRISSRTFVSAITSCDHWWSTVGEMEKRENPDLATFVDETIKELKKTFSV